MLLSAPYTVDLALIENDLENEKIDLEEARRYPRFEAYVQQLIAQQVAGIADAASVPEYLQETVAAEAAAAEAAAAAAQQEEVARRLKFGSPAQVNVHLVVVLCTGTAACV
jgi:non-ribosomal peptide synthetase component F